MEKEMNEIILDERKSEEEQFKAIFSKNIILFENTQIISGFDEIAQKFSINIEEPNFTII